MLDFPTGRVGWAGSTGSRASALAVSMVTTAVPWNYIYEILKGRRFFILAPWGRSKDLELFLKKTNLQRECNRNVQYAICMDQP